MAATKVAPQAPAAPKTTQPGQAAAGQPQGARPGASNPTAQGDKPGKTEKVVRVFHPLLKPEPKKNEKSGKTTIVPTAKLKEIPTDFDAKLHKPLQRKMFEDESLWFELRARYFDDQAKKMRAEAITARTTGSVGDKVKAKRLASMAKKYAELQEQLKGQGVDVAGIIAAALAAATPKPAEAAPAEAAKA